MGIFYEEDKTYGELLGEKKNFLFIGEAGSGKSEILLNTAAALAERAGVQSGRMEPQSGRARMQSGRMEPQSGLASGGSPDFDSRSASGGSSDFDSRSAGDGSPDRTVDVFDMDQSKPLFRSRDMAGKFAEKGITIHYSEQFQDAPVSVGGVRRSLTEDSKTLIDIGGGQQAAKIAGLYADILGQEDSVPIYVIDPYRPWSGSIEEIDATMTHILSSARLDHIYVLGNPNLGCDTTAEEFLEGLDKLDELMAGFTKVGSACVRRGIYEEVKNGTDKYLFPMDLYFKYEWA